MKYNDTASRKFQERSTDYEDRKFNTSFWGGSETRSDKRKRLNKFNHKLLTIKCSLNVVMNKREKLELYEEFCNGANGRWSNMSPNYDFTGTFDEFIEYLHNTHNDERIFKYKLRLRDYNITKLLS